MNARFSFFVILAVIAFATSIPAQGSDCGCAIGEVSPTSVEVNICDKVIAFTAEANMTCGSVPTGGASTNVVEKKNVGENTPTSIAVSFPVTCGHGKTLPASGTVKVYYVDDNGPVGGNGGSAGGGNEPAGGGGGGDRPGKGKGWVQSLHWQVSLGKASGGNLAGRLVLESDEPDARIYTPDALSLLGLRLQDVVYEPFTNHLMQILAPECFVQIATARSQTAYVIKFYTPDCLASEFATNVWYLYETAGASQVPIPGDVLLDVTTNLYYCLKSGAEPFVVHHVENPNPPSCNALRITESWSGGTTSVWDYAWEGSQWSLSEGGGLRTTQLAESAVGGNLVKRWSASANGRTASVIEKTYSTVNGRQLPIQIVSDPDGVALATTLEYHESGPSTGSLKKRVDADGSWTSHAYQSDNLESETRTGWLDGGSEDACRVTTRSYAPFLSTNDIPVGVPLDNGVTDWDTPRVETVTLAGVPVSKTLRTVALDAQGYRRIEEVRLLDPAETNLVAAWADPANPRTLSRYMPEDDFKPCSQQPELIVRPDGTATHYAYIDGFCTNGVDGLPGAFEIVSGGPHYTTTITHGTCESFGLAPDGLATNGFNGIPGRTTREVVVATKIGKLELQRETYVCTGQDTYERVSWTTTTRDELGRVVATHRSDGTRTESFWNGDLLAYEIGADGVRTDYTYDALGRVASATRYPLPLGEGQGEGASPQTVAYVYDAENRVLSTTRYPLPLGEGQGEGLSPQTVTNAYDGAGRLVWTRSPDGLETAYAYGFTPAGLPFSSTIRGYGTALASTNTVVRHKDGQIAWTEFNGVRKATYAYGVNADGSRWTLSVQGDLPEALASQLITYHSSLITELNFPWEMQLTDPLGRTIREERPGYDGAILVTENSYAPSGQLLATTQSTIVGSVPSVLSVDLYSYDALGEAVVTAQDIDLDGQIDYAGPDVVSSNATEYVNLASAWWRESRQYAFPDTGSAAPLLVSTSRQRLSGLGGAYSADGASGVLAAESVSIDARSNQSTSRTVVDRDTATVYQIAQAPDSTIASLSVTVNGLRQSSRSTHNLTTTYAYDALGRMVSMQDARGGVYSRGYDEYGRVAWESDPATNDTWYAYDALGRQTAVTNALGHVVETAYDAEDRVIATSGATYPVEYDYDDFGRMVAMRTFRDEEDPGDETRWLYEDATGVLTNKVYADGKGTAYSYTPDGKLASRTWARGGSTTYAYNGSGLLLSVDYSDTTPDVTYTYDRLGRMTSAIVAGVSTNTYAYDPETLALSVETQNGVVIDRATDSLGRATGFSVAGVGDPGSPYAVSYGYDTYGRFSQVSNFQFQVSYSYLSGSSLISGMTASSGHSWSRSYEPARSLITAVENRFGSAVISRFDYVNDAIGRRVSRADSGIAFDNPAFDKYAYNTRSEVIGAQRYHGTDVSDTSKVYGGRGFGYAYDPIGNRTSASETVGGETLAKSYTANALNQYTAIANPDAVGLRGSATNTATVTVNSNAASSDNVASDTVPWHFALQADNPNGGVNTFAEIMAVVNPPGTNTPDLVSTTSGSVYAPPQQETLAYDDDGNLLSDGRWEYTWNGENRLIKAEEQVCPTNRTLRKVEYAYDHQGRMVWKVVSRRGAEAQSWETEKSIAYLWDRFNIIAETTVADSATNTTYNVWGLDLDGTMQGAGGVGGLLAVISPLPLGEGSAVYLPCYDANGNIMEYVSGDGTITAHREYDPFGGTVVATGDANAFTHWFSTKPWCAATGLSEYQYRKYSPVMGRWLSRDPIWEKGGFNLYAAFANNPPLFIDPFGNALTWDKAILSGFKLVGGAVMTWVGVGVAIGGTALSGPAAWVGGGALMAWGMTTMADAVNEIHAAVNDLGPPDPIIVTSYYQYYEWASGGLELGEIGRQRVLIAYYSIDLTMACFSVHAAWNTIASKAVISRPVAAGLPGSLRGTLIYYQSTISIKAISTAGETPQIIYDGYSIYQDSEELWAHTIPFFSYEPPLPCQPTTGTMP